MSTHKSANPKSSSHELKLSYAQWLTTPSSSVSLERAPEPWFSAEVRDARDAKVRWIQLDQVVLDVDEERSSQPLERVSQHKSAPRSKDHRLDPEEDTVQDQDQSQTTSSDTTDTPETHEGALGHYLDHIEAVQQRDEARNARGETKSKRKRRSRRSRRGRAQTASLDQAKVHTKEASQGQSKSQSKTQATKTQTKTQSKRRRRRGRGKSKAAES